MSAKDREFIEALRLEHDLPFRDVVAPHFTMVFGCNDVPEFAYIEHVRSVSRTQEPIWFFCRYAMVCNDASNDYYYVFLVPDEGYGQISKLHDRLYRGILTQYLRLDIPYVPHMAIATNKDAQRIKALCDELNSDGVAIQGQINAMTVCSYDGSKITDLETLQCRT